MPAPGVNALAGGTAGTARAGLCIGSWRPDAPGRIFKDPRPVAAHSPPDEGGFGMGWKTGEGSTGRLLQYCLGYYASYVVYGTAVKYFQGPAAQGFPGLNQPAWLAYSTVGGSVVALVVCLGLRWYRLESNRPLQWGPVRFPSEWLYILPSGVLTAIIIPATTLLFSLPISIMVAMVIMRGAVIVVSRIVDAIQIRQGLLHRKVHPFENAAVVFALLAVGSTIFFGNTSGHAFDFVHSAAAMTILTSYVVAYGLRIYIMNYYKNTRAAGVRMNDKGFFAVEQMSAFTTLVVATLVLLAIPAPADSTGPRGQIALFQAAVKTPHALWMQASAAGTSYGIVAFFSVFLFMFKGRTATFAGLVNRLTSLVAGTTATLLFWLAFHGKRPTAEDWVSLGFILVAVGLLAAAERKHAAAARVAATPPGPAVHGTGVRRA